MLNPSFIRASATAFGLAAALCSPMATVAFAADTESTPVQNARVDDYAAGKAAVDAKNWSKAAEHFKKVVAQDPKNADGWNMLGYSNRWMGKTDDAFAAYGKALALQPNHKGANQYIGVAYLKTNDLLKAEAQLAKLDSICGQSCEEYKSLAKAISEFKASKS
ncbi:MAG: tetratricopeptide repeat protein [Burkholderiaceae bacterium]